MSLVIDLIKCCDCQATYIGETGRNLNTRLTEHKRATRNGDLNNNIAEHHLQTKRSEVVEMATKMGARRGLLAIIVFHDNFDATLAVLPNAPVKAEAY